MIVLGSDIIANRYTIDDTFGNNSWTAIKAVCQAGAIPSTWAVGDTKEITGKDGNTYHIRLVDKQSGRYNYSNSTLTTNAVFEFVELPNITSVYNISSTNSGGFASSQLRLNLNGLTGYQSGKNFMTDIIPDDLAAVLEEVDIVTSTGGSSFTGTSTSANKLFVGNYINYATSTTAQYTAEDALGQFDYYQGLSNGSQTLRKKALVTSSTSYQYYWTGSPYAGNTTYVRYVDYNGSMNYNNAYNTYYVAPCFAF